jgi:hypothetical protein
VTTTPRAWRAAQPLKTASGGNHGAARLVSRPTTARPQLAAPAKPRRPLAWRQRPPNRNGRQLRSPAAGPGKGSADNP